MYAWSVQGNNAIFTIGTDHPIHANNPHYAILNIQEPGASLVNEGYGGIVVRKGEKYDFSMFSKIMNGKKRRKDSYTFDVKRRERACPDNLVGFFQRLEKTNCSAEGCSRCR